MPIDDLYLLEFLVETVREAPDNAETVRVWRVYGGAVDSYFDDPMDSEDTRGQTLAELIDVDGTMMSALAQFWQDAGSTLPSEIIREIEAFIAETDLTSVGETENTPRLIDYVYPVV